jgi:oxygen-dependent protoporphyrinogen oxidase
VAPDVARELGGIRLASVGVIALAYDLADATGVPDLSGVLVPRTAGHMIKAVTISSRKWPHLRDVGRFVVRASVGRIDDDAPLTLEDDVLAERVDAEVRSALRIHAPARERQVVRWDDALPQYDVGHLERVDRLRHALRASGLRGLHVAGAALDGVGLAARAREAEALAREIRGAHGRIPERDPDPARRRAAP